MKKNNSELIITWKDAIRYNQKDYLLTSPVIMFAQFGNPARCVSEDVPIDVTRPTMPEASKEFRRQFAEMSKQLQKSGLIYNIVDAPDGPVEEEN